MADHYPYTQQWIAERWRWCSQCGEIWTYSDDLNCPCPESALRPFPAELVPIVYVAYSLSGDAGVVPIERKLWREYRRAQRKAAEPTIARKPLG